MMMKARFNILIYILLVATTAFAQKKVLTATEVTALKEKVAENTRSIVDLESDFTQTKHLDFMENDIKSSGKLYFKSPDKIRWEYTSPSRYYVIFDAAKIHTNDNGNKKTTNISANRMMKEINKIIAGTAQGTTVFDEEKFEISYAKNGTEYLSILKPKDKTIAKYIKQIELAFDGLSYLIKQIKITEVTLDYTLIKFNNQKKNSNIPESVFSFL